MFEWCEWQLERLIRKVHFGLIAKLYPELHRIQDEKDRRWALWFASQEETGWKRILACLTMIVVGPGILTTVVAVLLSRLGWFTESVVPIICVVTWLGGMFLTATLIEKIRGTRLRKSCYSAMRIFGQDVCPFCGYDMTGHIVVEHRSRVCPECGDAVPPLTHQRAA